MLNSYKTDSGATLLLDQRVQACMLLQAGPARLGFLPD